MRPYRCVVAPWRAALLAVALLGVAVPSARAAVPAALEKKSRYIVLLDDGAADAKSVADKQAGRLGFSVAGLFDRGLRGYVGSMTDRAAKALASTPGVLAVAPDTPVRVVEETAPATTQLLATSPGYANLPAIWGLDRIDHRADAPRLDGAYRYNATAPQVTAYVIDTGVRKTHQEFGDRVRAGFDAYRPKTDPAFAQDCDGHGTHVAGTLGGQTFGVAKNVEIVSVRVMDCAGSGLASNIVKGIDWVTGDHQPGEAAVANLSFGGATNAAIDAAVKRSIADDGGITFVVAAGNGSLLGSGKDACTVSPARVPEAVTVGATDSVDKRASFSNYGKCVDVFAPGKGVVSAYGGSASTDSSWKQLSGTSMAAPHAAGVAALILSIAPCPRPGSAPPCPSWRPPS